MAKVKDVRAIELFDARGNRTLSVTVVLEDGAVGRAALVGQQTFAHSEIDLKQSSE